VQAAARRGEIASPKYFHVTTSIWLQANAAQSIVMLITGNVDS
jgi:hypothetical protein